jgi:hypothetical protein
MTQILPSLFQAFSCHQVVNDIQAYSLAVPGPDPLDSSNLPSVHHVADSEPVAEAELEVDVEAMEMRNEAC